MRRILFEIPIPFTDRILPIYSYGFMVMLGFIFAILIARRSARDRGYDSNTILDLGLCALLGGIFGARLFHVIQFRSYYFDSERPFHLIDILKIYEGGLVFYGGLVGAFIAVLIYVRAKRLPFLVMLDLIAPAVMVGLAFGRIGCLLNGCCYGKLTKLPWGIVFPSEEALPYFGPQGHPARSIIHPTQVYESLAALAIFFLASIHFRRSRRPGTTVALVCALYAAWRFFVEFLRQDTAVLRGPTVSQVVSIIVFVVAVPAYFLFSAGKPLEEPASQPGGNPQPQAHRGRK